jgi:hypothetical protein
MGKGGFAVSFYVLPNLKRNIHSSSGANRCGVCRLLCKQCLLVTHSTQRAVISVLDLLRLGSVSKQRLTASGKG